MVVTRQTDREDQTFRSAQTIIGPLLQNFQNKAKHSAIVIHTIGFDPHPTALPYGNGMFLHFYQQQESSTTKTVHKVINKGLKAYV